MKKMGEAILIFFKSYHMKKSLLFPWKVLRNWGGGSATKWMRDMVYSKTCHDERVIRCGLVVCLPQRRAV